jgi:hypothetical protein
MATTADIEAAIAELRAAEKPNISATASKYNIRRTRLSRLYNGQITTREDYKANKRFLSKEQDKKLLDFVNRLTREGLPSTPKIVRQFAKDISRRLPGKNWPRDWLDSYKDELQSSHLKGFDLDCKKADSFWQYKAYFELVFTSLTPKACAYSYS